MPNVIDLDLVREGDQHLKRAKRLNPNVTTRPVEVAQIITGQRQTFTVPELARLVGVHPQTIRRAIEAGELKAAQSGQHGHFRVSHAEAQIWWTQRGGGVLLRNGEANTPLSGNGQDEAQDTPEERAKGILQALRSGDKARRNAAIIRLAKSDEATIDLVEEAIEAAEAAYDGPQDDLSDWRTLDGEPFHFPEEPTDYLTGLYKSDKPEGEAR